MFDSNNTYRRGRVVEMEMGMGMGWRCWCWC